MQANIQYWVDEGFDGCSFLNNNANCMRSVLSILDTNAMYLIVYMINDTPSTIYYSSK